MTAADDVTCNADHDCRWFGAGHDGAWPDHHSAPLQRPSRLAAPCIIARKITQQVAITRPDRRVPQAHSLFGEMTVRENLELGGFKHRRDAARVRRLIERVFAMFPRLRERAAQNAGTLSGGEQQMLVLGRAMMSEPHLLCLDEPSLGLAPLIIKDIFAAIRQLRESGLTILLVEQMAKQALGVADRAYVLETGHITLEGSGRELLDDPKVKAAYLGTH